MAAFHAGIIRVVGHVRHVPELVANPAKRRRAQRIDGLVARRRDGQALAVGARGGTAAAPPNAS
jgi:hypothetical protein